MVQSRIPISVLGFSPAGGLDHCGILVSVWPHDAKPFAGRAVVLFIRLLPKWIRLPTL